MHSKILIAAAWPYTNGSLHLGHVAALIGADVLARYFRLSGNDVLFVSGSDCHGTPIVVEADRQKVHPLVIAEKYHHEFIETLISGLGFSYDLYSNTLTQNHQRVVQKIFLRLHEKGYIYTKVEDLPFCSECQRFLPDRYIEGECPNCHFASARGDQCDNCGNLINPRDLLKPKCKVCESAPEWKPSEHFFLKLSVLQEELKKWVEESEGWRVNAKNLTINALKQGLPDRAITRDTEWGIPIPIAGYENKRIYVWFEAVCGYLSASEEWAKNSGNEDAWREYWENDKALHFYVHGKDNILFHTIIWPAILLGYGGLHLPDKIVSSEYLTLESKQFSKSRRWAIWLPEFLSKFDPEALRFFLLSSGPESSDSDFSWSEFRIKTNSELIGNFGNFVHRVSSFVKKSFPNGVRFPESIDEEAMKFLSLAEETFVFVGNAIEEGHFREGIRCVLRLVEHGNRYVHNAAPWSTIKNDQSKAESDLAVAGHVIKCLAILVNPFLPKSSEKICNDVGWKFSEIKWVYPEPGLFIAIDPKPLYKRIEVDDIDDENCLLKNDLI